MKNTKSLNITNFYQEEGEEDANCEDSPGICPVKHTETNINPLLTNKGNLSKKDAQTFRLQSASSLCVHPFMSQKVNKNPEMAKAKPSGGDKTHKINIDPYLASESMPFSLMEDESPYPSSLDNSEVEIFCISRKNKRASRSYEMKGNRDMSSREILLKIM